MVRPFLQPLHIARVNFLRLGVAVEVVHQRLRGGVLALADEVAARKQAALDGRIKLLVTLRALVHRREHHRRRRDAFARLRALFDAFGSTEKTLHANMGDQDPPAWWWLSNKTRYLWFGGHSTDSSRGNMYFGSVNELSGDQVKALEGTYEDVHQWSLTVEAPDYPAGYCSGAGGEPAAADHPGCIRRPLAEQGAILFHAKDLWGEGLDNPTPRLPAN